MIPRRAFAAVAAAATILVAGGAVASASLGDQRQLVSGARVVAVADRLARSLVDGAGRSIAPAFAVADQNVPAGDVAIAVAGSPTITATYVSVPVAIRVDGKLVRTVVAGYRVTAYVDTVVAAHDLAPGAVLAPGDVATARIASNGRPAVEIDALVGRKLNVALAKGAPVYVESTIANVVVKAGQAAILVVRDGPVALTADVVARTGGAVGDTVTVLNPQTQKAIAAIVTGPNRVELTLPEVTP